MESAKDILHVVRRGCVASGRARCEARVCRVRSGRRTVLAATPVVVRMEQMEGATGFAVNATGPGASIHMGHRPRIGTAAEVER